MNTSATATDWASRPGVSAVTPEKLAALIAAAERANEGMLFTATARAELDTIRTFSRLADLAWAGELRGEELDRVTDWLGPDDLDDLDRAGPRPDLAERPGPRPDPVLDALREMDRAPVERDLSTGSYRIGKRLRRYLEARDRTCVFPGCGRPALFTDKDHRIPWPLGYRPCQPAMPLPA